MPNKLFQFSFSGGVFSPTLHGRSDLEKYSLGLRDALNYFVDYRGGIVSRAGSEFGDYIPDAINGVVFHTFKFNARLANTFLLIFTTGKLRFAQNNAYVLEPAQAFTAIISGVVSQVAHSYSTGDYVKIEDQFYIVGITAANTYTLTTSQNAATTITSGAGSTFRVYTLDTPFAATDLPLLVLRQRRNEIIITTETQPTQLLTRNDQTDWTLIDAPFGGADVLVSPTGLTATASASGAASIIWTVTAVDHDGRESTLTTIAQKLSIVNYVATAGSVTFSWASRLGAQYYKVYRSIVFPAAPAAGQEMGYIGRTVTTSFVDNNIIPDFTQNPPLVNNPFAHGAIGYMDVTAAGTGYTTATVSITDPTGSGFVGSVLISGTTVAGLLVLNAGSGYSAPVVTISGDGADATATATLGALSGLYPSASIVYNQRLWLMGSTAFPLRLTASRSEGDLLDFNQGLFPTATDPIILDIDSGELTPIRYGELVSDSIFVFTDQSVWQISNSDGNYKAELRTENGVGLVAPLRINRDILFTLSEGTGVWALRPSNLPTYYVDVDLTTFAGHLFSKDDEIISWAFAREPYRVLWAATRKGRLLSMTYLSEQNVYAWMPHNTRGKVRSLTTLKENGIDRVYWAVERDNGVFFERMSVRDHATVEDIWAVDAGLSTTLLYPAADLSVTQVSIYTHTCTASAPVFSSGSVGEHVRAGGGRGEIVSYTSPTEVTVEFDMPIVERAFQSTDYPLFLEGEWSSTPLQTSVTGLDHLNSHTVEIFADGSDFGTAVVVDGAVTLDQPASQITIGLGFDGFAETLPLISPDAIIEDRVKNIHTVAIRVEKTRGLAYQVSGPVYDVKERTTEAMRAPTTFQQGIKLLTTLDDWAIDTSIKFIKRGPTASTILMLIADVEIGDDPD